MYKKILLGFICGIVILGFCGCNESEEEKAKRKQYSETASENAIKYIENKYGFTPKVTSTKCTFDNGDMFSSSCEDEMIVNLKYNNKSFAVHISASEESIDGVDNYQYEEIVSSLLKLMPYQNEIYSYGFYYGYVYDWRSRDDKYVYNGLIKRYYDGSNLEEIMEDEYLRGVVNYINHNSFEELKDNMSPRFPAFKKLFIVNYKSIASYKKTRTHTYNVTGTYSERDFYENSENLKDVVTLYYGKQYYYNFN